MRKTNVIADAYDESHWRYVSIYFANYLLGGSWFKDQRKEKVQSDNDVNNNQAKKNMPIYKYHDYLNVHLFYLVFLK